MKKKIVNSVLENRFPTYHKIPFNGPGIYCGPSMETLHTSLPLPLLLESWILDEAGALEDCVGEDFHGYKKPT